MGPKPFKEGNASSQSLHICGKVATRRREGGLVAPGLEICGDLRVDPGVDKDFNEV